MCGIIGYIGENNCDYEKIKLLMLYNSLERGKDSTGLYTPNNGIIKTIDEASTFLTRDEFKNLDPDNLFIGHVRKRSSGTIIENNAHPFKYKSIIGVHNGTLSNYELIKKDLPINDINSIDVDSKLIMYRLANDNNPSILKELSGSITILFYNIDEPDTLYAYSNGIKPLYYGLLNYGIYFSSEKKALDLIECVNIKELKHKIIYKFDKQGLIGIAKINTKIRYESTHNRYNFTNSIIKAVTLLDLFHNNYTKIWIKYTGFTDENLTNGEYYLLKRFGNTPYNKLYVKKDLDDENEFEIRWVDIDHNKLRDLFDTTKFIVCIKDAYDTNNKLVYKKNELLILQDYTINYKNDLFSVMSSEDNSKDNPIPKYLVKPYEYKMVHQRNLFNDSIDDDPNHDNTEDVKDLNDSDNYKNDMMIKNIDNYLIIDDYPISDNIKVCLKTIINKTRDITNKIINLEDEDVEIMETNICKLEEYMENIEFLHLQ